MENYQLYRTNIALSGSLKMNIILDNTFNDLYVTDSYLTTLNDKYTRLFKLDRPRLEGNHLSNIKEFYINNVSKFYGGMSANPNNVIFGGGEPLFDYSLCCGLKHETISQYKKQYEYFCPIWIEKGKKIFIHFDAYSPGGDKLCTRVLNLTDGVNEYHKIFSKYLNTYINSIGLDEGCDNLLNIDIENNIASIEGINVEIGKPLVKNINHILPNLISRERPLIETDNLLISQFESNKLICKQLLNLSFHFNICDIVTPSIYDMMGDNVKVGVRVEVDGKVLNIRDFYSNYEYIPKVFCGPVASYNNDDEDVVETIAPPNVLTYLMDNQCVDLVNVNKKTQSVIHWSLVDNNDYIFNLYDGFAGYSIDLDGNIMKHSHHYANSADMLSDNVDPMGNLGWCNYISLNYIGDRVAVKNAGRRIAVDINRLKTYATDFSPMWVNNIKYRKFNDELNHVEKHLKVLLIHNNSMVVNEDGSQEHLNISEWGSLGNVVKYEVNGHIIYVIFQRRMENGIYIDYLFIYGDDIRDLTFKSILSMVYKASGASNRDTIKNVVGQLQTKLKSTDSSKNPQAISLLSTLNIQRSNSPSLSSTEIEYYKSKQPGGYIFRYVGKIKPTFISNGDRWFNYRYGQKTFTDTTWKEYSRYYSTGFLPTFPSIGYTNYVREVEDYDWYDKKEIK